MLRYAPRFHDFFLIGKKKLSKFFREFIFREFFFQTFWLSWFRSQFGECLQTFGESRPTGFGGDRPRTNSSKPKTQIYI
jgi:hypothetical protein